MRRRRSHLDSPPSRAETGAAARRTRGLYWAAVLALIALAGLVRLPVFLNAWGDFNSDEAVNALVIRHLLTQGELALHSWDTTYYGMVEGWIALPFVGLLGFEPMAFRLGAFAGHALLMAWTFALGRRVFGAAVGLVAAAILAVLSPQVVQWSTLASGGYLLTVAWGTLSFLVLEATRRRPTLPRLALLGFVLGFGLYIYELYLIYLAVFVVSGVLGSPWLAAVRTGRLRRAHREWLARELPAATRRWGAVAAGFVVGWSPKLGVLLRDDQGTKRPSYAIASPDAVLVQLDRLVTECIPALLGVNPVGDPRVESAIGASGTGLRILGVVLLCLVAAGWGASAFRCRGELKCLLLLRPVGLGQEALLVILVPLTALAFVLSSNPQDVLSNRYLLPWLSSLPILVGAWIVRRRRRHPAWAVACLLLLLALPAVQTASFFRSRGFLGPGLEVRRVGNQVRHLLGYLEDAGIRGGYASYWVAYKLTMLSGERVVLTPYDDWSRYAPYAELVAGLDDPAYVFHQHEPHLGRFLQRLEASGREARVTAVGPYRVYTSADDRPLLTTGR